ncbi:hypothetical protein B5K08_05445 [Rhizobium leguminosarum bv. trifolii]|uniref:Uncharacterized protein n=1 Tax=Rhizobium leguminosarum bv. trifolii TaxID=386 RepID=A0A3E1BXL1_RHILT|nr:hypothetical protein [Rhizobium leguminosarum]RFB97994.1 hypothetical protein B5K08_05445 [Rhizobium leguminosarum bv. trifolii]RFB99947.1 hypothetical protein B5K10_05435 [Rhizobium leguminosarum bv. trifolii]
MAEFKAGVAATLLAIQKHFTGHQVTTRVTPTGGAHVIIEDVPLGPPYRQASTWIGFHLSDACPYDDTYPFYVRDDLSRIDGAVLRAPPLHGGQTFPADGSTTETRPAVMVSRRQRDQGSFAFESPLLKLLKVLKWMKEQ